MHDRLWSVLLAAVLVVFFMGCAEKQFKTVDVDKQAAAEKQSAAVKESGAGKTEALTGSSAGGQAETAGAKKAHAGDTYVVKKGDCLWWIAKYKDVYGDAFLWPLIFDANKKLIKNPNRIYPGQTLVVPRSGISMDAIKKARKKAGAPKPYTPPEGSNPPVS